MKSGWATNGVLNFYHYFDEDRSFCGKQTLLPAFQYELTMYPCGTRCSTCCTLYVSIAMNKDEAGWILKAADDVMANT